MLLAQFLQPQQPSTDCPTLLPKHPHAASLCVLLPAGGGHNHRMGLYDQMMIKDNHVTAAGGVAAAVALAEKFIAEKVCACSRRCIGGGGFFPFPMQGLANMQILVEALPQGSQPSMRPFPTFSQPLPPAFCAQGLAGMQIVVETRTMAEVEEMLGLLAAGSAPHVCRVMLDNMTRWVA